MSFAAMASWSAVIFGFVAAVLWFWATIVIVEAKDDEDDHGWKNAAWVEVNEETGRQIDIHETAKAQTYWNRWAAAATAATALCQAIATALSQISH
jgi:hypothetical protein